MLMSPEVVKHSVAWRCILNNLNAL